MLDLNGIRERIKSFAKMAKAYRCMEYEPSYKDIADAQDDRISLLAAIDNVRVKVAAIKELNDLHARVGGWTDKEAFTAFNTRYTEAKNAAFVALEELIGKEETDILYEAQTHCQQCEERCRTEE